ncbi:hypothetical protein G6F57_005762 [Rhizopus arrhizus]|uniref:TPR-like protein n=1 Tax=Rhizopus oryzae TaxID=64495 RepID=A0A9P7BSI6_RHIOR|nr:hypothetical protein G6F23_006862 [Rhizopus arrhizus]KAG1425110.1 hypothetical protein G6F58_002075 [Rhizopus delemar]KAG0764200.1 hypothetical protein G6F24_005412 [Rhizopus arrhizus]KAG0790782.1 hypothetical protein G6F21_005550 [Rhizopus arrhizus]KAG0800412.1 hypothetical protein G6F22_002257 [Rhizopus arrhizus]
MSYTVDDLKLKINENIDKLDYQAAHLFCQKGLELDPRNAELLELTAQVELELEKFEEAHNHLLQSIEVAPNEGYSKYMYLGQMLTEKQAIEAFQKGVELMMIERKKIEDPSSEEAKFLCSKISSALCSMTEIYLTDCCFEPEAESKCEEYLSQAQQVDPENPEVYQLLASVRLSQQRNEEASSALNKSMELWIHKEPGDVTIPIYDTRLALVKLLLELGMFEHAFTVLENLQKENDEVVDLWYLYGWTYYCLGDDEERTQEERITLWGDARDCLETAVKLFQMIGSDDEAMFEHSKELLQIINQVVPETVEEEEEVNEELEIESDGDDDDAMEE